MNQMILSTEEWTSSLPPRPAAAPAAAAAAASSSKRRFVKLGRKTSDGSVQSASSTSSSAEGVVVRQPSKSRIRRHTNRLSGVFLRGPASSSGSMALASGLRTSLSVQTKKSSAICADALVADDPAELSNQITAPGILKIFGNEICEGAHYKSVLATTHSSAKELVKEALERYGLSKEEAESYVLCDTIGSIDQRRWRTEGFRVVGDNEKPLLLQSLWKPREGLARRFEIQRRSSVEEKTSRDKDTVTAGLNAQARKLQKSRSRVASTLIDRTAAQSHKLWRSKSEMDLLDPDADAEERDRCGKDRSGSLNQTSLRCQTSPAQNHIHGLVPAAPPDAATESLCPPRPRGEREGEESEREETESSDDNTTQYSIHPPYDCPYLLLLQGCSPAQDYVIYLLAGTRTAIGRQSDRDDGSKLDIPLFADDVLSPSHCFFHRPGAGAATALCPCEGAVVTRNGEALKEEVQLSPGDVIGLGRFYLFLFKDPLNLTHKEVTSAAPESGLLAVPWMLGHNPSTDHVTEMNHCNSRTSTCTDPQSVSSKQVLSRCPPCIKSSEGHSLTLSYEAEDEDRIVKEIVDVGSSRLEDRPPLTAAFLLCVCIQHSATRLHQSDLRRLLLLIAGGVQSAVWEHTKDLAAVQPETLNGGGPNSGNLRTLGLHDVTSGLRPLVVWMSNSLELLQFIQYQLPLILEWRTGNEQGLEEEEEEEEEDEERSDALLELHLSCVRSASEETMAVLEEVIMLAFQQCVYYITKILYPILPGLLDCNPFRKTPERQATASVLDTGGLQVPGEVQQVVEVLNEAWILFSDCRLHPEISSQLIGYLFYFVNASLVNSLMERGSEPGFYQWSRGVRMRASLDLLLDWAHAAGQGETALEQTHTLASAINLLATPRKNLLQTSWKSLRSHFAALSPAQLNHLLSLYSPGSPCRHTWTPAAQDEAAVLRTAEILESFDTQHPLVLPGGGHQFQLRRPAVDSALKDELDKLGEFVSSLRKPPAADDHQNGCCLPATVQNHSPASATLAPSPLPSPPSTRYRDEFASCGAFLLSQKLRHLELQITTTTTPTRRSALDPSCLLTPPNTPHHVDPDEADKRTKPDVEMLPWTSDVDDEGGLVFECLAALKVDRLKPDCPSMKRILEIKEEDEEEDEEEEQDNYYDDVNDEVFSLELERGERGLGLSLVDTRETSFRVKGVFIQSVVPDSPAGRSGKLVPGDQILAVNGVSLLGLDYKSGKELIQSSGERLRLLVTRCDWMTKAMETGC